MLLMIIAITSLTVYSAFDLTEQKVTISINEGWNLIPIIWDLQLIQEESPINSKDLELGYLYFPTRNEYVKYFEKGRRIKNGEIVSLEVQELIMEKPSFFSGDKDTQSYIASRSS